MPLEPGPGRAGAGGSASESPAVGGAGGGSGAVANEGQGGSGFVPSGAGGGAGAGVDVLADAAVPDPAVPDPAGLDAGLSSDAASPSPCSAIADVCDGLDNNCDSIIDPAGACAVGCVGFALLGRGYMFCSDALARSPALARCQAEGLRLAWIETPAENAALVSAIEQANVPSPAGNPELLTQIGGSDANAEGQWFWIGNALVSRGVQFWVGAAAGDGFPGVYQNWSGPEPNDSGGDEDCAAISVLGSDTRAAGQWDDRSCDVTLPFVCEQP